MQHGGYVSYCCRTIGQFHFSSVSGPSYTYYWPHILQTAICLLLTSYYFQIMLMSFNWLPWLLMNYIILPNLTYSIMSFNDDVINRWRNRLHNRLSYAWVTLDNKINSACAIPLSLAWYSICILSKAWVTLDNWISSVWVTLDNRISSAWAIPLSLAWNPIYLLLISG